MHLVFPQVLNQFMEGHFVCHADHMLRPSVPCPFDMITFAVFVECVVVT